MRVAPSFNGVSGDRWPVTGQEHSYWSLVTGHRSRI